MALTQADIDKLKSAIKENSAGCSDDIRQLVEANVLQNEQIKNLTELVGNVTKTIYGNGKPGLVTDISNIKMVVGVLKWAGTIISGLVMGFLWLVFTGQLTVIK